MKICKYAFVNIVKQKQIEKRLPEAWRELFAFSFFICVRDLRLPYALAGGVCQKRELI